MAGTLDLWTLILGDLNRRCRAPVSGRPVEPSFRPLQHATAYLGDGIRRALSTQRFAEYITHGKKRHRNRQPWQHSASAPFIEACRGRKAGLGRLEQGLHPRSIEQVVVKNRFSGNHRRNTFWTTLGRRGGPGTKARQRIERPIL